MGKPQLIHDVDALRAVMRKWRQAGRTVGLVPTMGALHEGHLSLVRASRSMCDETAVTIFVNPTQFAPGEDLDQYPRTLESDLEQLAAVDASLVFCPDVATMYPEGFSTSVEPPAVATRLEGECRPGHFRGVATVVLKLFQLLPADVAFFGQKDFQQQLVIRHMVRDLNVPTRIETCPIVRESDGLAMSSRNRYLSPTEREQALALHRALQAASDQVGQGERDPEPIRAQAERVLRDHGIERIDYVALADPQSLEEAVRPLSLPVVMLIAAYVGSTRLIDNLVIS